MPTGKKADVLTGRKGNQRFQVHFGLNPRREGEGDAWNRSDKKIVLIYEFYNIFDAAFLSPEAECPWASIDPFLA